MALEQLFLFFLCTFLGTISFGEFSSVLEQSSPVQDADSCNNETAGMDTVDASFTQSSSHSLMPGSYCIILFVYINFIPACNFSFSAVAFNAGWVTRRGIQHSNM